MKLCEISKYIYIMYIAWTIEIVPKHCFKKGAYLCLNEMKRELHRTTKHENAKHVVFIIAQVSSD